jgi:glycosyltransferase involved in cell wall biosynthesis
MMDRLSAEPIAEISVIMSVRNGEKYLPEAIESILDQSFEAFEFIIVNDGLNSP